MYRVPLLQIESEHVDSLLSLCSPTKSPRKSPEESPHRRTVEKLRAAIEETPQKVPNGEEEEEESGGRGKRRWESAFEPLRRPERDEIVPGTAESHGSIESSQFEESQYHTPKRQQQQQQQQQQQDGEQAQLQSTPQATSTSTSTVTQENQMKSPLSVLKDKTMKPCRQPRTQCKEDFSQFCVGRSASMVAKALPLLAPHEHHGCAETAMFVESVLNLVELVMLSGTTTTQPECVSGLIERATAAMAKLPEKIRDQLVQRTVLIYERLEEEENEEVQILTAFIKGAAAH